MSRSIVYPKEIDTTTDMRKEEPTDVSKYGGKLAKYVPAEVLAFFVPAVALIQTDSGLWWIFALAAFFTPVLVWLIAKREKVSQQWFTYVIALLAFVVWSIGTTAIGTSLFALGSGEAALVLMCGVFIIPLLDEAACHLFHHGEKEHGDPIQAV